MYSKEFIEKVKDIYPDSPTIIRLAENGDEFLGRYLDDNSACGISPETILNNSYDNLCKKAIDLQKRKELYAYWLSGMAYDKETLMERKCPISFMQDNGDKERYDFEGYLCKEVRYVGYYPDCKNWSCREKCWQRYFELKDMPVEDRK